MRKHKPQRNQRDPSAARLDEPTRRRLGTIWYLIGLAWQCGDGLDENERLAIDSFRRAAGYGNTEAMFCLADYCLYRDRDLMKALDWWILAFRTDPDSGKQVIENGESETVRRYREAAGRSRPGAQVRLGECCFWGNGTKRNRREAVKWFRRAAAVGNARAILDLGDCYFSGVCVKKNEAEAYRLWRLSAERGYAEAQYCIAGCYEYGLFVPQDHEEALRWFRLAAAQGHRDAKQEIRENFAE